MKQIAHLKWIVFLPATLALLLQPKCTFGHDEHVHVAITRRAASSSENLKHFCLDAFGVDVWVNMPKFNYDSSNLPIFGWSEFSDNGWRSGWLDRGS